MIRALVTGCRGQVGAQLVRSLEGRAQVFAYDRQALDLQDPQAIAARVRADRPDLILNAGAYTAVDRAETDAATAHAVNAVAPGILADEAKRAGALLIHFSTDYVFDGTKTAPYIEEDATHPLSVYGSTKLEGERAISRAGCDHLILRTSWVYGPRGGNFVRTMLRLAATRPEIRVVDDQHGAPTSSLQLARAVMDLVLAGQSARPIEARDLARLRDARGTYHATAAGETTWFGFAAAIFADQARERGPGFAAPRLVPIPTSEYSTPARRPANSRLSCRKLEEVLGVRIGDWRDGLRETLSVLDRV